MAGPLIRPLGRSERYFWLFDRANCLNHAAIVEVIKHLSREKLQEALNRAQNRHPILQSRIVRRGNKVNFEAVDIQAEKINVQEQKLESYQSEIEHQLDLHFEPGAYPLVRCLLFKTDQSHKSKVVLILSHAISDAIAGTSLLTEIILDATDSEAFSHSLAAQDKRPIPALEHLYPSEATGLLGGLKLLHFYISQSLDWFRLGLPKQLPDFKCLLYRKRMIRLITFTLDHATMQSLISKCHTKQTTIHGVIGASALIAINRELFDGQQTTLSLASPVSLRGSLSCLVAPNDVGSFISTILTVYSVSCQKKIWQLAQELSSQLKKRAARGDAYSFWKSIPPLSLFPCNKVGSTLTNRLMHLQPPAVLISNIKCLDGNVDTAINTCAASLTFAICPEFQYPPAFCVSSLKNRMFVNIVYSEVALNREKGERVAAVFHQQLLEAAA